MEKNLFIVKAELRKSNSVITDLLQTNIVNEGKIIEKLEEIKETIKINYQYIDNKSTEIDYNMNIFKKNCRGAMDTFEATIAMYEEAHRRGAEYIASKTGEL